MSLSHISENQAQLLLLGAPPLISQEIKERQVAIPNFMRDMYSVEPFPLGHGTAMQELIFRGKLPAIERDFSKYRKLGDTTGCDPCAPPDCSRNWSPLGGYGIERKVFELMDRSFRSDDYCVKQIQTTQDFDKIIEFSVNTLFRQIDFHKEINIGYTALKLLAKKFVVDSGSPKANQVNPYAFPDVGPTVQLSTLNIRIFEVFYQYLRMALSTGDIIPAATVNGAPMFFSLMHPDDLSVLHLTDPHLRLDLRGSDLAANLLKYNFMTSIREMFIPVSNLYSSRYNRVDGQFVEVSPWLNDVPLEHGSYTSFNPEYVEAEYGSIILMGMQPFKIYTMPTATTVGAGTQFGAESTFFDDFKWFADRNNCDPTGRTGFFFTEATFGISQGYSQAIFEVLYRRLPNWTVYSHPPAPATVLAEPTITNVIPDQTGCPCPLVASYVVNPITEDTYFLSLHAPFDSSAGSITELDLTLANGAVVTATVENVNEDDTVYEVSYGVGITPPEACDILGVSCAELLNCYSRVNQCLYDLSAGDYVLRLQQPIFGAPADVLTVIYGSGALGTGTIGAIDNVTMTVTLSEVTGGEVGEKIVGVCVPTAVEASCPGCDVGPEVTPCVPE